jgi:hypothetical protein
MCGVLTLAACVREYDWIHDPVQEKPPENDL